MVQIKIFNETVYTVCTGDLEEFTSLYYELYTTSTVISAMCNKNN